MSTKAKVLLGYLAIALASALYLSLWGPSAYRGFAYNLGSGLIWPVVLFPGLGKLLGGLILLAVIGVLLAT